MKCGGKLDHGPGGADFFIGVDLDLLVQSLESLKEKASFRALEFIICAQN